MDTEEEPSRQQGCPLPHEPLRQDPPQARATYVFTINDVILSLILDIFAVKQERVKEQKVKRGKKAKASSAGEAFLNTLFAP